MSIKKIFSAIIVVTERVTHLKKHNALLKHANGQRTTPDSYPTAPTQYLLCYIRRSSSFN